MTKDLIVSVNISDILGGAHCGLFLFGKRRASDLTQLKRSPVQPGRTLRYPQRRPLIASGGRAAWRRGYPLRLHADRPLPSLAEAPQPFALLGLGLLFRSDEGFDREC